MGVRLGPSPVIEEGRPAVDFNHAEADGKSFRPTNLD